MTEAFLHYVWQYQMLGSGLTTVDGQPVVVLKPGVLNHDSGPDFFNARIRVGEVEWVGNVEVHVHSSDWTAHHHERDAAYNSIVLHVVYEHDAEVIMQNGKRPVTLALKSFLHPSLVENYEVLMAPTAERCIPCRSRVGEVPDLILRSFLERMTVERIETKSAMVHRLLEESRGNWVQTCYWLLARYFGGKVNALPFELLAKSVDLNLLSRWRNNPERIEALLMGQAGLLTGYFEDDYPRALQADYEPLRSAARLEPIAAYLWKFFCMRPSSFPTIRISQFARLLSQSDNLFSTLLETTEVQAMEQLFNREAASYWNDHYQFDRLSNTSSVKRLGKAQADLLIINAWVPLLFVYGQEHGQQQYKEQALSLLNQLEAENNAVIRMWKQAGVVPANAAESQALLQVSDAYCENRRCLECRLGYQILRKERWQKV